MGSDWKAYVPCGLLPAVMTAPVCTRLAIQWYKRGTVAVAPAQWSSQDHRLLLRSQTMAPRSKPLLSLRGAVLGEGLLSGYAIDVRTTRCHRTRA